MPNETNFVMRLSRIAAAAAVLVSLAPAAALAQAFEYPAFQLPRVTEAREYNFAFADGDNSQSLVFQWREGYGPGSQLSFDVGFSDIDIPGGDPALLVGGQYAQQLTTVSADIPVDVALTVGANLAAFTGTPSGVLLRVPLGVVAGRTIVIDAPTGFAITPYVHPRVSLDYLSDDNVDGNVDDNTDLGLNVDIGANFQFTRAFAGRLAFTIGGDEFASGDAFGISFALTPGRARR